MSKGQEKKPSSESEKKYRMIFENANDGIVIHDLKGNIIDVNRSMFNRLGYTKNEMLRMNLNDLVSSKFAEKIRVRTKKLEKNNVAIFESQDKRRDGTIMPVEVSARMIDYEGRKAIQSVVRDISDRKIAEDVIQNIQKSKETLVLEMKAFNHLNILINEFLLDALENCPLDAQKKVIQKFKKRQAILTFILDKILDTPDILIIDFRELVRSLIVYLTNQYNFDMKNRQIKLKMENIFLDISHSLRCAFILSELILQSLSFASTDSNKGLIEICVWKTESSEVSLGVRDSVAGQGKEMDMLPPESKGYQLVDTLVKKINGSIQPVSKKGREFCISFQDKE